MTGLMSDETFHRRKMRSLLMLSTAYLVLLGSIFVSRTAIETTRINIDDLHLSGKTVAQAEGILKSEGYGPHEYVVITDDGNPAAPVWEVAKVEEGRKARIFVDSQDVPDISTLNLVGTVFHYAKEKMADVGMVESRDYRVEYDNGDKPSSFIRGGLTVMEVDTTDGIPVVVLEGSSKKSSTDEGSGTHNNSGGIDVSSLIEALLAPGSDSQQ
jgi:hypothetical protein